MRTPVADLLGDGMRSVAARPGRAALSAIGIALAVATVILVTGIPASGNAALQQRLTRLGSDVLVAQASSIGNSAPQLPTATVGMVSRIGPVTSAAAVANLNVPVRRNPYTAPNITIGITALAVQGDLLDAVHGQIREGRFLDHASAALSGVVLGAAAAKWLGIDHPGAAGRIEILVGGEPFTVVGVLAPMPLHPELDQAVFIGASSAHTVLGWNGHPSVVYLRSVESQLNAVRAVLPRTLAPDLPGLIDVSRPSEVLAAKQETTSAFAALGLALAAVALLVGGIGVSNTMVVAVLERRREIGVRRALGARRTDIILLVLTEAVLLALLGAGAGLVLGSISVTGVAIANAWPVVLAVPALIGGGAGAAVVGCIAGLQPAVRAGRMSPTEALAS